MRPVARITPALPAQAYKTYQVVAPRSTHFRPATCAEVGCPAHGCGWRTVVDERTDLGQQQAHYIRAMSGRAFTAARDAAGLTTFTFEAGQACFQPHRVRLDRPEHYLVRGGDYRGNPTRAVRRHVSAADWTEDFAEHQTRLADRLRRG